MTNTIEKTRIFLKDKREVMGMNTAELAELVFGDRKYSYRVTNFENGKRGSITLVTLEKILTALNSDIEFIEYD